MTTTTAQIILMFVHSNEFSFQAKKIEEHERKRQRKREEKELIEKKERIRKAREAAAAAKAAAETKVKRLGHQTNNNP